MNYSITITKTIDSYERLPKATVHVLNYTNGSMKGTKVFTYWHDGKDYLKLANQYKRQMQRTLA